jgi:hypothetical protein
MGFYWGKQKCIVFPEKRNHVGIGAVEKNMLLILDHLYHTGHRQGNYIDSMSESRKKNHNT